MIARKLPLESAANAQRGGGRGGSTLGGAAAGQQRPGVDLRGNQGQGNGGCC
jgi:Ras-related protein Rab-5C